MKLKWSGKRTLVALALLGGVLVLYAMGAEEQRAKQDAESDTSQECRVTSTVDGLNVRSAPVKDPANVVGQLSAGEEADAHKEVENGFRKLADERWVAVEFAQPMEGRDCG